MRSKNKDLIVDILSQKLLETKWTEDDKSQMSFLGEEAFIQQKIWFNLASMAHLYRNMQIDMVYMNYASEQIMEKYFESQTVAFN